MRSIKVLLMGVMGSFFLACGASNAPGTDWENASLVPTETPQDNSGYFTIRPDTRRCHVLPCGGYFVKQVNREQTRCANGQDQLECHVSDFDLSALQLGPQGEAQLRTQPEEFLVRGEFTNPSANTATLRLSEAWHGHEGIIPSGEHYRVKNSGIVCITYPCMSYSAALLNSEREPQMMAGVDVEGIGGDPASAQQQMNQAEGLMVAAVTTTVTGPAGSATALDASEYYLPYRAQESQYCGSRGLSPCPQGQYCSFTQEAQCGRSDQPGSCAIQPQACTQQYDPVCGCDGNTYGNACTAASAGVSVDHTGECAAG